jgi:hypothetical protein
MQVFKKRDECVKLKHFVSRKSDLRKVQQEREVGEARERGVVGGWRRLTEKLEE